MVAPFSLLAGAVRMAAAALRLRAPLGRLLAVVAAELLAAVVDRRLLAATGVVRASALGRLIGFGHDDPPFGPRADLGKVEQEVCRITEGTEYEVGRLNRILDKALLEVFV